jgi:hypothetical protein
MKYEVVISRGAMFEAKMQIEAHIAKMIADGWKPIGGVSMYQEEYVGVFFYKEIFIVFAQAMIKEEI